MFYVAVEKLKYMFSVKLMIESHIYSLGSSSSYRPDETSASVPVHHREYSRRENCGQSRNEVEAR